MFIIFLQFGVSIMIATSSQSYVYVLTESFHKSIHRIMLL